MDLSLLELNEDQEIAAPEDARPFDWARECVGRIQDRGSPAK
jgi:hypothetical protein